MVRIAKKQREVLFYILQGLSIKNIAKETGMALNKVYRARDKLLKSGFLSKTKEGLYIQGTGQSERGNTSLIIPDRANFFPPLKSNWIRYHNIQVSIDILQYPNGWLEKSNGIFFRNADRLFGLTKYIETKGAEHTGRIYREKVVIQIPEVTKENLEDAENEAVNILERTARLIEARYKITLIKDGYLNFKLNKGHYALIHNEFAETYKDKKEKLKIYWKDGKVRLLVDFSVNKLEGASSPEFEAVHPIKAPDDARTFKTFFTEFADHPISPIEIEEYQKRQDFIEKAIANLGENMNTHVSVMQNINVGIRELRQEIANLRSERKAIQGGKTITPHVVSFKAPDCSLREWL